LERIDREFWRQLQRLAPFGVGHPAPLFWSSRCRVAESKLLRGGHLQLVLEQGTTRLRAIAWRWQGETDVQGQVDVAYRLRLDRWQGEERLQLELLGIRPSCADEVVLRRNSRTYWCRRQGEGLVIRNAEGEEMVAGVACGIVADAAPHPYVRALVMEAAMALGLTA
jgi:single-stranded-DNA-specific exonuclease